MSAAIWAAVIPIVVLIVRHVVMDILEEQRVKRERDRRDLE